MVELQQFDKAIETLQNEVVRLKKDRRSRILGIINTNEVLNPNGLIADMTREIENVELQIKTLQEERREVKRASVIAEFESKKSEAETRIEECTAQIEKIEGEVTSFRENATPDELDIVKNSPMGLRAFPRLKGLFFKTENLQARVTHDLQVVRELSEKIRELSEV